MRRHGIVLGLFSGPDERMASMRRVGGDLQVMGEIGVQYHGLDPSDTWFEPYPAMAEEFDIPVGIGRGGAESQEPAARVVPPEARLPIAPGHP